MKDHNQIIAELRKAQDDEDDNRNRSHEAHRFITERGGQWEPEWWEKNKDKPRYQFDLTTPIVSQVASALKRAEFGIEVDPIGGQGSKEYAAKIESIIRNIQVISNAKTIFNEAARDVVIGGIAGWRVVHQYVDDDSFEQDLMIVPIYNFLDRVWFDRDSVRRDRSDAKWCVIAQGLTPERYDELYPDGSKMGLRDETRNGRSASDNGLILVGELLYIQDEPRELVLMSDGSVYEDGEEYQAQREMLALQGITEVKRRNRPKKCVYSRKFDATDWLEEPRKTVFSSWIPVIPAMANYTVLDNEVFYHGMVEKLMDPQRVHNYSVSREIEEGALAPRAKFWMTEKQASGHERQLETLNTNADPVQFFNPDEMVPGPPQQLGGAQINQGLRVISEATRDAMGHISGQFEASMGDNPRAQSGVAIERLQDRGDAGSIEYFEAMEVAIGHTGRIIVDAIPKVYDTPRRLRLVGDDGSIQFTEVNDPTANEPLMLEDLKAGTYDVTCTAGPSFRNKQDAIVSMMLEAGQAIPQALQIGSDILFSNITAPGADQVAERLREQLFNQGMIPIEQMTEEEKQEAMQAAQQPAPPDPNMLLAQAEQLKGQADLLEAQTKQQIAAQKAQSDMMNAQTDVYEAQTDRYEAEIKAQEVGYNIQHKAAQTEGQQVQNMISMQQLKQMSLEQVMGLMGPPVDFEYDPEQGVVRASR